MDQPRFKTALLFGITVGFLTIVELAPFLVSVSSPQDSITSNGNGGGYNEYRVKSSHTAPFADVALHILTFTALLVGMATGSLLPRLLMGVSLGSVVSLVLMSVLGSGFGVAFPVVCGLCALVAGGISCR
jgi:H+/Cl- antiporter ClcA